MKFTASNRRQVIADEPMQISSSGGLRSKVWAGFKIGCRTENETTGRSVYYNAVLDRDEAARLAIYLIEQLTDKPEHMPGPMGGQRKPPISLTIDKLTFKLDMLREYVKVRDDSKTPAT